MNILLIHQNFPGQFKHIALDLLKEGKHHLHVICEQSAPGMPGTGIRSSRYKLDRGNTKGLHRYVTTLESGVIRGQAAARVMLKLRDKGYRPDVVLAHPGWGEALFVKDVFPNARLIGFCEFFYHARGADMGFDPTQQISVDDYARIRIRNSLHLTNLEACDIGVSPTEWQKSLHPLAYQSKIRLVHEGIDTQNLVPNAKASFKLPNGVTLKAGDPVLTYVARNLEPYRGFTPFMHALTKVIKTCPNAQVVIVGGDEVSYGAAPSGTKTWREKLLKETGLGTPPNVHFLGRIPYPRFTELLCVSKVHVYLTYPFVLSWSMLEAMSSGALLLGSATAPVQEVIENGKNGLLVDFFDVDGIASRIADALQDRIPKVAAIRQQARQTVVDRYSVERGVAGYRQLMGLV